MHKLLILSLVVMLTACGAQKIKDESIFIGADIERGRIIDTVKNGNLSTAETQVLEHSIVMYHKMSDKYRGLVVRDKAMSMTEARKDFDTVAIQYRQLVDIVVRHWDDTTDKDKLHLVEFDRHARNLEKGFDQFEKERQVLMMVGNIVQYAGVIADMVNKASVPSV